MDEVIVRWVLEYLLRQRIDDRILNDLLSVLPIADDSRLKKILLLRRIESEVSNAIVSEEILELLEIIEKLDLCDGKAASESMKAAYCTVAVDCTVRFLEENVEKNGNYFEAVKRIWRIKVSKMEKSENNAVGLVSEKLLRWRDEIEGAIWDSNARDKILMRNTRNEALKAVRLYLAEAWEGMGPSFLELAAQTMSKTGNNGRRAGGEDIVGGCRELVVLDNTAVDGGGGVKGDNHQGLTMNEPAEGDKETQKAKSLLRCKHVASHGRRFKSVAGRSRGVKMTNASKVDKNKSMEQTDLPPTPEISKLQNSLKSTSMELQKAVKDPLSEALLMAETVSTGMGRDDMDNPTARTYLCDESIENSASGSGSRPHLPSPKTGNVGPLKNYKDAKFMRKRKRWSPLEEDTLLLGVQKFGIGNWKQISNEYRHVFEERTVVDLKDKWRNLTR